MMRYLVTLVISFTIMGCAQDGTGPFDGQSDLAAGDMMGEPRSDTPSGFLIEYIQHSKGENFTEEALYEKVREWNEILDRMENKSLFANILMPVKPDGKIIGHFAEGQLNFTWAIGWPSMDVRDAAWSEWMEKGHQQWQESIHGVFSYDPSTVIFMPTIGRQPTVQSVSENAVVEFNTCAFKNSQDHDDLASFRQRFDLLVDDYEKQNGATSYFYFLLDFAGEMAPAVKEEPAKKAWSGYFWANVWSSLDERDQGLAFYSGSDLAMQADALSSCVSNLATVTRIRTESETPSLNSDI